MIESAKPDPGNKSCEFRFYEELNRFLPAARRKAAFDHGFDGTPSVKDRIEALGVPHTEVDLILVDGVSVGFSHRLKGGERVAVYPVFERLDLAKTNRLRPEPLRKPRFILDVHLGRLAAYLRLLGFDCLWRNDLHDIEIIDLSRAEHRIILTRDAGLLKDRRVTHGGFVHTTDPAKQLREVIGRFQLENRLRPLTRCTICNGALHPVSPRNLADEVPAAVLNRFDDFSRCAGCSKVYWRGSHYDRMRARLAAVGIRLPVPVLQAD